MNVVKILGTALRVGEAAAPAVASAINPAAGAVIGVVVDAVTKAEATGGSSVAKKEQVMQTVLPAASSIMSAVLRTKNPNVHVDPNQLSTAVSSIVDGVVALMHSVQASPSPAAPAPQVESSPAAST